MTNLSSNKRMTSLWPRRPTLLMGFATLWSLPGLAPALELGEGFDLAALTTHGIDPKVSDYFRSAARFREGVQVVGLRVNGNPWAWWMHGSIHTGSCVLPLGCWRKPGW